MVSEPEEPRRRWVVPPALYREPGELLEGVEVLEEVPPPLGTILWDALRDVILWAEVDPVERAGLFAAEAAAGRARTIAVAAVPSSLAVALQPLTALLEQPDQAPGEVVAAACASISRWAASRPAPRTALAFAQAGARAQPSHARTAVHVADLARELRRHARAVSWYRRAVGLGRRAKDWRAYTESLLRLGELGLDRGNVSAAKRYVVRVLRAARRHGVHDFTGDAHRMLFRIAALAGDETQMATLARRAVRAYGRDDTRTVRFLLEVARAWIEGGSAGRAESILTGLQERLTDPDDAAVASALVVRAAAALNKRRVFDASWSIAWAFLRSRPDDDPVTKTILGDLSSAAAKMGDWDRMGQALARAGGERPDGAR